MSSENGRNEKIVHTCAYCRNEFHPYYVINQNNKSLYCSPDCYRKARWGNSHSVETVCLECGKSFISYQAKAQKFCSKPCHDKHRVGKPNPGRSNRVTRQCSWCGEDVTRPASNFHSDKTFCDYACEAEWMSEFQNGKAHPRWKGGDSRTYGIGWKHARIEAFNLSGGTCQKCKRRPATQVHHKLPVRYFENIEDAHTPNNLIALCIKCHVIEHQKITQSLPLLDILQFQRSVSSLNPLDS